MSQTRMDIASKEEALNDSMEYVEVPSLTEHLDFHLNKILTAVDPQKTYDVLETIGMPFRDQVTFCPYCSLLY